MELDFSALAKEDELLFIFRSLTPEQQMTLLGMLRGVLVELIRRKLVEHASPMTRRTLVERHPPEWKGVERIGVERRSVRRRLTPPRPKRPRLSSLRTFLSANG